MKASSTLAVLVVVLLGQPAIAGDFGDRQRKHKRVAAAHAANGAEVQRLFVDAKAAWPPRGMLVRAFKGEGRLQLWAAPASAPTTGRYVLVREWEVCAASGTIGPKEVMGDLQVPEGFYTIDRYNAWSQFHLSLGINYPNAVDRARSGHRRPGGDIFIHGSCASIGCLAIEDDPIEELYLAAVASRDRTGKRVPVHVFPCDLAKDGCQAILSEALKLRPELTRHWLDLATGFELFEREGRPPRVTARATGYTIRSGAKR